MVIKLKCCILDCKETTTISSTKGIKNYNSRVENDESVGHYCKKHKPISHRRAQRCGLIKCENPAVDCKPFCWIHEKQFRFKCCLNIEGKIFCERHYKKYLIYEKENETSDEGLETLIQVDNPLDYGYKINNE